MSAMRPEHVRRLTCTVLTSLSAEETASNFNIGPGRNLLMGLISIQFSENDQGFVMKIGHMAFIASLKDGMFKSSTCQSSPIGTMVHDEILPLLPMLTWVLEL
jgi:hypothetical protein